MAIVLAAAHTAELAANITMAVSSAGLRPHISETFAHIGDEAADVRRYAEPTHV